jgi:F-type H+-transporting ATPase subunit delta
MKISKEARRLARQMFRASLTNGRLDRTSVTKATDMVIAGKPRHYLQALKEFARLIRLESARRHAIIQSATALDAGEAETIAARVHTNFGSDITTEFQVNPTLLGGLRVQVGSDVWDGSVRNRLDLITQQL